MLSFPYEIFLTCFRVVESTQPVFTAVKSDSQVANTAITSPWGEADLHTCEIYQI